jgi:hypothetical protein
VYFNDSCCSGAAELRSVILKAPRLAHDYAEQQAGGRRGQKLAARPDRKKRCAPPAVIADMGPDIPFAPERLAA